MHTEGPGIWRKKLKITENEKYNTFRTENMAAGKLKRWKIQKCPLQGREYGKKKLKIMENEKHPLDDLKMTQITKKTRK